MNIENRGGGGEQQSNQVDLNKILDDLGFPVGAKRAAALLTLGGVLVGGACAASNTAENIGPDPNLSCPGDFDVNKGVLVTTDFDYVAQGTNGRTVEVGDDYMTEFNNGQLRLIREVKGGKKYGDIQSWAFTDEDGTIHRGSFQPSENIDPICEDE